MGKGVRRRSAFEGVRSNVRNGLSWSEAFARRSRGVREAFARRSRGVREATRQYLRVRREGVLRRSDAFGGVRKRSGFWGANCA